jgi:hypothetical protein
VSWKTLCDGRAFFIARSLLKVQPPTASIQKVQNDDDDYNDTPDYQQAGGVAGEDDLLPITLHKVVPAFPGTKYTLGIPAGVKIWQHSDRSVAVVGTTEFDANVDTTLYVEGVSTGPSDVVLKWTNGTTNFQDESTITVFSWLGPLDVPGYGVYRYTATDALPASKASEDN